MTAMFAAGPVGFGLGLQRRRGSGGRSARPGPAARRPSAGWPAGRWCRATATWRRLSGRWGLAGACGGGQDTVGPGGGFLAQAAGVPVRIQRPDDACSVVPGVVVQGVAEHRAQGPPLQPDDGVGEGGVAGFDLPGQPPAEGGAGGAQGLLARLPLLRHSRRGPRRASRRRGSRAGPGGSGTCRRRAGAAARPGPRPPGPPSTPPCWSRRTGPGPPQRRRRAPGRRRRRCRGTG